MAHPFSQPTPTGYFAALEKVREWRVSSLHPPTSSKENGMDSERCSRLHNAIVEHSWISSGYDLDDLPRKTWWHHVVECLNFDEEALQRHLHPSVVEFLQQAILLTQFPGEPKSCSFFYHLPRMEVPQGFFLYDSLAGPGDPYEDIIVLYTKRSELVGDLYDGLIYDQKTHSCMFNQWDPADIFLPMLSNEILPWQPLEDVFSVYLELIETGKVVALHRSVQPPPHVLPIKYEDGSSALASLLPAKYPQYDPVSGTQRIGADENPWKMEPFTGQDVSDCLSSWDVFVQTIEDRMPSPPTSNVEYGLYEDNILRAAGIPEDGFAWKILRSMRKPRFSNIGPGLRIQSIEEMVNQPYKTAEDPVIEDHRIYGGQYPVLSDSVPPILLFCADGKSESGIKWLPESSPAGLYLDFCSRAGVSPYENGCRLLLPFEIGAKADSHAKTADGVPMNSCDMLYQIGSRNPFLPTHSTPISTVFDFWTRHVQSAKWKIDDNGVTGSIEEFKDAESVAANQLGGRNIVAGPYILQLGPGSHF